MKEWRSYSHSREVDTRDSNFTPRAIQDIWEEICDIWGIWEDIWDIWSICDIWGIWDILKDIQ